MPDRHHPVVVDEDELEVGLAVLVEDDTAGGAGRERCFDLQHLAGGDAHVARRLRNVATPGRRQATGRCAADDIAIGDRP